MRGLEINTNMHSNEYNTLIQQVKNAWCKKLFCCCQTLFIIESQSKHQRTPCEMYILYLNIEIQRHRIQLHTELETNKTNLGVSR